MTIDNISRPINNPFKGMSSDSGWLLYWDDRAKNKHWIKKTCYLNHSVAGFIMHFNDTLQKG